MKLKLSLIGILSLVLTSSGFSQGTINFVNSASELVTIEGIGPAASSIYGTRIQLYYQPGTVPQPASISSFGGLGNWIAIGTVGTNITTNGRFSVGTVTTGSDVPGGGGVWLEAAAWTGADLGTATTFSSLSDAVQDGRSLIGVSSIWAQATGDFSAVPPSTPINTSRNGFSGLVIPTPEPSTYALMGMGAVSMFLFRRRK